MHQQSSSGFGDKLPPEIYKLFEVTILDCTSHYLVNYCDCLCVNRPTGAEQLSEVSSGQVQKALGKGSYGTVYRAKRYSDGKLYALKEADVGSMTGLERKDAVNEIRLMASIRHENIVKYHQAILDGESK